MEQNSNKAKKQRKAPWWLKAWGIFAFYGLFLGAAETPDGGIAFWWTFSWIANFGVFGYVANKYDWGDDEKSAEKTEGAE